MNNYEKELALLKEKLSVSEKTAKENQENYENLTSGRVFARLLEAGGSKDLEDFLE